MGREVLDDDLIRMIRIAESDVFKFDFALQESSARLPVSSAFLVEKSETWSPAAAAVCIWVMPWARVLRGEVNSRT